MAKARRSPRRRAAGRSARPGGAGARAGLFAPGAHETDPVTGYESEVRAIPPYAAVKAYVCPGCNQEIRTGVGHVVVVPLAEPAARRHWHAGCWANRHRRPGR